MLQKGIPVKFVELVMSYVTHGEVAILVNDYIGPYFETRMGLRQGRLFCLILQ